MKCLKKSLIFDPAENDSNWINSYAAIPVVNLISDTVLRIYFSTRDPNGRSLPTFIDVSADNPHDIRYIHDKPILKLGKIGTFDDNGIMPSSIVYFDGKTYLYYIGWNPQVTVSYRLSIGLAISRDGINFYKYSEGPLMDRDKYEPYFNTAPHVIIDNGKWKMWYVSCTGWKIINDWPEPLYLIRYAESDNGINWERMNVECIGYDEFAHAIGRPFVYKDNNLYKMIYSYRNSVDYRSDPKRSYRLGYAESFDGLNWERKDHCIDLKSNPQFWDSVMQEYCSIYTFNDTTYLLYNGNGFGKAGFGYAILES